MTQNQTPQTPQMPAGREMDSLIAVKVFRAQIAPANHAEDFFERREDRPWEQMPYYSTDIAAAWQVVEALCKSNDWPELASCKHSDNEPWSWRCQLWASDGRLLDAYAETAPLAVCRAALKVLASTEQEGGGEAPAGCLNCNGDCDDSCAP